jgi:hypothetical protein
MWLLIRWRLGHVLAEAGVTALVDSKAAVDVPRSTTVSQKQQSSLWHKPMLPLTQIQLTLLVGEMRRQARQMYQLQRVPFQPVRTAEPQ